MEYQKKTWVEVDLDRLAHNYHVIRSAIPDQTRFLGVVKADAYGHGAVPVSLHLQELGADYFAVSNLDEAIQLRRGGIDRPILILGYTPPEFAIEMTLLKITQEVHSLEYAKALSKSLPVGQTLRIHIKLDTGMSRLGFFSYDRPETADEIREISELPHLQIEGCLQHFAAADGRSTDDRAYTRLQYRRFQEMLDQIRALGVDPGICHCANSGAVIDYPEYAMDMVRPGIATYGLSPSEELSGVLDLKPILSWKASIGQIRSFPAGVSISYARTFTTARPSRIAVLSVGYGDGLSRALSNGWEVVLHGKRVPIVGRICMDMCMIDVTDVPETKVEDPVTLISSEATEGITAEDMAQRLGTISYEVLCGISKRVPRLYLRNGEVADELRYIV
ncbi:MAG: alanine racemase [Oscillospiraceae bacterium]|nr:alanine racemase [Oscillospiraceae bacterium]